MCPPFLTGDILLVSPSPSSLNKPLIRVVRILLSSEDCYTFDFDSLICLRAPQSTGSPDVICFSNRTGRIFHGICLHVPQADLQSNSRTQGMFFLAISFISRTKCTNNLPY